MTGNVAQELFPKFDLLYNTLNSQLQDPQIERNNIIHQEWKYILNYYDGNNEIAFLFFCSYVHLRLRGFRVGCGTKFGVHFLLYEDAIENVNTCRIHSKYMVLVENSATYHLISDPLKLNAYLRLATIVKKKLIIVSVQQKKQISIKEDEDSMEGELLNKSTKQCHHEHFEKYKHNSVANINTSSSCLSILGVITTHFSINCIMCETMK